MTRKGFSLLEMLVAIFLLSIIIAILGQLFPFSKNALRRSEDVSVAVFLAQQVMEENLVRPELERDREGDFEPPYQEFRYTLSQQSFDGDAFMNRLRVEVFKAERRLYYVETVVFR